MPSVRNFFLSCVGNSRAYLQILLVIPGGFRRRIETTFAADASAETRKRRAASSHLHTYSCDLRYIVVDVSSVVQHRGIPRWRALAQMQESQTALDRRGTPRTHHVRLGTAYREVRSTCGRSNFPCRLS